MASVETATAIPSLSRTDLAGAIVRFLADYSVEVTPHDSDNVSNYSRFLTPGTRVYVAHPPGCGVADVIDFAVKLREFDFMPVPHLIARRLRNRGELDGVLERLGEAGIGDVLIVAGDDELAQGPYTCTMEVLETQLLEHYEFTNLGIAGHPEGSRHIGSHMLKQALAEKARYAESSPLKVHIVTQFGFNPDAVLNWERRVAEQGIRLPIHVGMAGLTRLRRLIRLGMRCGIGASLRQLTRRTSALANVAKVTAPDQLITAYASHCAGAAKTQIVKPHFFAFGGVEQTAHWLNAVVRGDFSLRADGSGFEVQL